MNPRKKVQVEAVEWECEEPGCGKRITAMTDARLAYLVDAHCHYKHKKKGEG